MGVTANGVSTPPYECSFCDSVWSTARGFGAHFDRVGHDYSDHQQAQEETADE